MKRFNLVRKTFRDVRGATLGFSLTTFSIALFVMLLYPTYKDMFKGFQIPESLRKVLGEDAPAGSFEQFIAQEFFVWVPIILIVFAIMGATATLAGEEGAGTLDLLLAQPVTRSRVVLEKSAGLLIALIAATLASLPGFLLGGLAVGMGRYAGPITMAVFNMLPLIFFFLMAGIWASAANQSRGAAVAAITGSVVLTYFLNIFGAMAPGLEFMRYGSPFYWSDASRVLVHGIDFISTGALIALGTMLLLLALWSFNSRDLAAGNQEFSLRAMLNLTSFHSWTKRNGPRKPSSIAVK